MSGSEPQELIQWREAQRWLLKADEDLAAARLLIAGGLIDPAAFHVQQALEKALKALLVAAGKDIRRTHDLETLAAAANNYWPSLVASLSSFAGVSEWYLISRYPDMDEIAPTRDEVEEVLGQFEALLQQIKARAPAFPAARQKPTDER